MADGEAAAAAEPASSGGDAILGAALEGLRRAAEEVEVERSTAETLQRSVLRENLPELAGLRLAARYLPGSAEARIGGDWYDVIPLRDGRVALVIGDVVGRGIAAAARMAHLQSAVRAYALEGLRPSLVLDRMNGFALELEGRGTATMMFAVIDAESETMRMASAGHPPPLMIEDGDAHFVEIPAGNPLGAFAFPSYEESVVGLRPGVTVLLYTDGLIEAPGEPIDAGMERVRLQAEALSEDPAELCQALLKELLDRGTQHDDIALLGAHLDAPPEVLELTMPADPGSLVSVRQTLTRWMRSKDVSDTESYELLVASGEACANAIAHAYPVGDARFNVRASKEGDDLVIEVRDFGEWREPRPGRGGRGLSLIEKLTDSMEIDRGRAGTTVRLRRRIGAGVAA